MTQQSILALYTVTYLKARVYRRRLGAVGGTYLNLRNL